MSDRIREPAFEGWYGVDEDGPHLIGARCAACGTYCFPPVSRACPNPGCSNRDDPNSEYEGQHAGKGLERVRLSRTGTLWSYTNACYQPPEPYVSANPFQPFAIAAVSLEREKMIVLGQVVQSFGVERLRVGMRMQLVLETLYSDEQSEKIVWKWRPAEEEA